jgi:hypothetical protein
VRKGWSVNCAARAKVSSDEFFLKQAGQYRSHQTEGFFEQTNVEDELCVYDFEQAQTGRIRSVLKRDDS